MSGANARGEAEAEIRAIGAAIRQARDAVSAGATIDVGPMEVRVGGLCDRLARLPAPEGAGLRAGVQAMIEDFSLLARLIEARLAGLRKTLAQASVAQAPAGRPGAPRR